MKSTPIYKDTVGDRKISTVLIEPFGYYETAIWNPKEKRWEIYETCYTSGGAQEQHNRAVTLCDKAQHYEER